ncbi:WecB/TagA/CpsF family glycosyltransferase [Cognatishimia activa]|uniref:Putative N-acetylmannosaminyltransferase n=1 Tax=Cognatishimia activa TaxID=1715691 RepID=A0A0P1IN43_9RHOB|nr:WecB/TagA/CpsF family glycosyltransferase [Cognatishimia activa]CUJ13301.1 Putative N-acetylmannosaminyltransferase [Cognatishimia activa]CUK24957.1 Putative N-acetylmannosaminyltransferase [Cognatishimia activa]
MQYHTANGPVSVNIADIVTLTNLVSAKIQSGQGFALATLNLDHLVKMNSDQAFYDAYLAQELVVADGNPVVWLSWLAKQPVKLQPGSDLILPLCRLAASLNLSVAFLGSTDETLKQAEAALKSKIPDLNVVLKLSPAFGFDPQGSAAEEALKQVQASGASLCFLALGAPKQEILAARGRKLAASTGFVSIGAGLDFLAGSQERAPKWVRQIAMEWLWRLVSNPRRLAARYAMCFAILPGHFTRALRARFNGTEATPHV